MYEGSAIPKVTRRDFLKNTGLAVVAGSLVSVAETQPLHLFAPPAYRARKVARLADLRVNQ